MEREEHKRALFNELAHFLKYQGELGYEGGAVDWSPPASSAQAPPAVVTQVAPQLERRPQPQIPARKKNAAIESPQPSAALQTVRDELGDCTRCKLHQGRTSIVFGVGNPTARLMFVGEGPGRDEDLQGEPFVGMAGQLLDKMIAAMGLRRADIYIANVIKCRPPQNRDPEPGEVEQCEPFLVKQIQAIKPEVIVALGKHAAHTLLRQTTPISRLRGQWKSYENVPLMPTFHPAYLLRNPGDKKLVWQDLQEVMKRLGLPAPR